jgi:hypothetical protein
MDYWKEIEAIISDLTLTHPKEADELRILFNYTFSGAEMLMSSVSILLSLKNTVHPSIAARINALEQFCNGIGLFPKSRSLPRV